VKRREFIAILGGAAAWPLNARAQQPERMRRLGVLMGVLATNPASQQEAEALRQSLHGLGWTEGRNIRIDYRWGAYDPGRAQPLAKEIAAQQPDVIIALATEAVEAILHETRDIPLVFVNLSDPVGRGFIKSLARPGGNITGFTNFENSMGGKWLEVLKEIAPQTSRVGLLFGSDARPMAPYLHSVQDAAASFAVEVITISAHDTADIENGIVSLAREPHAGLVVLPHLFTGVNSAFIINSTAEHRLPAVYPYSFFAKAGGLVSYGIDAVEQFRRTAAYVDRILRGAKAGELPVQAPTKFELIINLKTAKALGVNVPLHLQQVADEMIE
jgi:ABC-type uncharacterized transport system substrate-binding protein